MTSWGADNSSGQQPRRLTPPQIQTEGRPLAQTRTEQFGQQQGRQYSLEFPNNGQRSLLRSSCPNILIGPIQESSSSNSSALEITPQSRSLSITRGFNQYNIVRLLFDKIWPLHVDLGVVSDQTIRHGLRRLPKGGAYHNHLSSLPVQNVSRLAVENQLYFDRKQKTFVPDDGKGNLGKYPPNDYKNSNSKASVALAKVIQCTDKRESAEKVKSHFFEKSFKPTDGISNHVSLFKLHCELIDVFESDNIQCLESMQEYSIPPPDCLEEQMQNFRNLLASEEVQELDNGDFEAFVTERCALLVDAMLTAVEKDQNMEHLIAQYEECDLKCGEYIAKKRDRKRKEKGKPPKPAVLYSSPDSPITGICVREIRRDANIDVFVWQCVCSYYLIEKTKLVRSLSPVGSEDDLQSFIDFRAQMAILKYLKERFNHPELTVHTGEFGTGRIVNSGVRTRIADTIRWLATPNPSALRPPETIRMSHVTCLANSTESPIILCKKIKEADIAVEVALSSNEYLMKISLNSHPFLDFCTHKLSVILVADDVGHFDTDLTQEFVKAYILLINRKQKKEAFNQVIGFIRNSIHYGFLSGGTRYNSIYERKSADDFLTVKAEFLPIIYGDKCDLKEAFRELEIDDSPKAQKGIRVERKLAKAFSKIVEEYRETLESDIQEMVIAKLNDFFEADWLHKAYIATAKKEYFQFKEIILRTRVEGRIHAIFKEFEQQYPTLAFQQLIAIDEKDSMNASCLC